LRGAGLGTHGLPLGRPRHESRPHPQKLTCCTVTGDVAAASRRATPDGTPALSGWVWAAATPMGRVLDPLTRPSENRGHQPRRRPRLDHREAHLSRLAAKRHNREPSAQRRDGGLHPLQKATGRDDPANQSRIPGRPQRAATRVLGTARQPALRQRFSPPASCLEYLRTRRLCERPLPLAPSHHRATRPGARRRTPRRCGAARGSHAAEARRSTRSRHARRVWAPSHDEPSMEPLWSPVVATSGNQRQIDRHSKPQKQAKSVATGCDRLPRTSMVRNAMKKGLPRSNAPRVLDRRREAPRNVVRRVGSQSQASRLPPARR
jgi:hypothetical protein